jgi:hypothetical protein
MPLQRHPPSILFLTQDTFTVKRVASAVGEGEGSVVVQAIHARLASLRETSRVTLV